MQKYKNIYDKTLPYLGIGWFLLIACFITLCLIWPAADIDFWNILTEEWFQRAFLNTLVVVVLMMKIVSYSGRYLDRKIPWEEKPWERLLMQLIFGWALSAGIGYLVTWFFSAQLNIDNRVMRSRSLILLISLLLNSLYVVRYFILKVIGPKLTEPEPVLETDREQEGYPVFFMIPDGKGEKKVLVIDIAYIARAENNTLIYSHRGAIDICYLSLDFLISRLDPHLFFRANRSYIIAKDAVDGYSRQSDRKLKVNLIPQCDSPTVVSRTKAKQLIYWFKAGKSNISILRGQ
jgi:hypothetical protein